MLWVFRHEFNIKQKTIELWLLKYLELTNFSLKSKGEVSPNNIVGWVESNYRNPTMNFEQIWKIHL